MERQIIIRDEANRLNGVLVEDGLFIPSIQRTLEVVDEDDEGINVIYEKNHLKLVENPVTREWWLLDGNGAPRIIPKNNFRPLVCKNLKWIALPIPKNGCASLLKSALYYDNYITEPERSDNEMAWVAFNKKRSLVELPYYKARDGGMLTDGTHKVFMVVSDERSRLLRWMNWQNTNRYNKFYSYDLPTEKLVDELLWSRRFITKGFYTCDQHALSQKVFTDRFCELYFKGDKELFERSVERVDLKELPEFFLKNFGKQLVKNNVTPENKKRFRWEELTDSQRVLIDRLAAD